MRTEARTSTKSKGKIVTTMGEIFSDGAIIELVRPPAESTKPNLLLWKVTAATTAAQMQYGDRIYESPELIADVYRAIRFPTSCSDYRSLRALFDGIAAAFDQHLQLSERESRLLTSFALSTWLADHLPIAPTLVISGRDQRLGIEVLKLLSCICRRSLLLAELTPSGFRSLPMQLSPTLLINQQSMRPSMLRLFRASNYRGLHLIGNRGALIDIYGPKAIFCRSDSVNDLLGECAIQISLAQSRSGLTVLDDAAQAKIADEFQAQLLSFRLKNLVTLRESPVDGNEFTEATREVAFALGACLSEDPELAHETIQLLRTQDDDARAEKQCDVSYVVVEILWGLVHHSQQKNIVVEELAKMVNALLRSRGGAQNYNAEEIGWKLRAMGVPRHSSVDGRQVVLDGANRRKIHDLARAYELPSTVAAENCSDCGVIQDAVSK